MKNLWAVRQRNNRPPVCMSRALSCHPFSTTLTPILNPLKVIFRLYISQYLLSATASSVIAQAQTPDNLNANLHKQVARVPTTPSVLIPAFAMTFPHVTILRAKHVTPRHAHPWDTILRLNQARHRDGAFPCHNDRAINGYMVSLNIIQADIFPVSSSFVR